MPNKGIDGLYEDCCDGNFYEWHIQEIDGEYSISNGYICNAPIFYKAAEVLTLREDVYNSDEGLATFRITKFPSGSRDQRLPHRPYKTFQLESDDDLMLLKCKIRPVIIIKGISCDWSQPYRYFSDLWLCLPIFSYKDRHSQQYVQADQGLSSPHRFYLPPGLPGLDEEGAGRLNELQFIPKQNLTPYKRFCDEREVSMDRPVRLAKDAFHAVVGHIAKLFPDIEITGESKEWYDYFKELVNEQIPKVVGRD